MPDDKAEVKTGNRHIGWSPMMMSGVEKRVGMNADGAAELSFGSDWADPPKVRKSEYHGIQQRI